MNPVSKYKWYVYQDKRPLTVDTSDKDYDLTFTQGDKFGYFRRGTKHYVVHRGDLEFQVRIRERDAQRLVDNSRGWQGKIKGEVVGAGEGGVDKRKKLADDPNLYVLEINSSNLKSAVYYKKEKELEIEFVSGPVWRYGDVTLRLAKNLEAAESQGSFFHYKIKNAKPQYKVRG